MAGSLNHLIDENGEYNEDSIENLGDAYEALDECWRIIVEFTDGDLARLQAVCRRVGAVVPKRLPQPKPPWWSGEGKG